MVQPIDVTIQKGNVSCFSDTMPVVVILLVSNAICLFSAAVRKAVLFMRQNSVV